MEQASMSRVASKLTRYRARETSIMIVSRCRSGIVVGHGIVLKQILTRRWEKERDEITFFGGDWGYVMQGPLDYLIALPCMPNVRIAESLHWRVPTQGSSGLTLQ